MLYGNHHDNTMILSRRIYFHVKVAMNIELANKIPGLSRLFEIKIFYECIGNVGNAQFLMSYTYLPN